MKNFKIVFVILIIIFLGVIVYYKKNTQEVLVVPVVKQDDNGTINLDEVTPKSDLINNICRRDKDCWSTDGGCFTKEWFVLEDKKARERGVYNYRPIDTPEIICTCDNNQCTVHK